MNGNNNVGASKKRSYRTIKVAPTTRAIRAALAASATMLALTATSPAFAVGICAVGPGLLDVTCNGVFTDDVTSYVAATPADMTLIVGTDDATTVDPAMFVNGISSYWGGDAAVISYAEINVGYADGIHMQSDGTASVSNFGSIDVYAGSAGDQGIHVYTYNAGGDVTVVNGGDITVGNNGSYQATGIYVTALEGFVTVDNQEGASITATSADGNAYGVLFGGNGYGGDITNAGTIFASSFTNAATGIEAFSVDGGFDVDNSGNIEALSLTDETTGMEIHSIFSDVTITNSGTIYVGGEGYSEGIDAGALFATISVTNSGTIDVTSYLNGAVGIDVYGKYADVTNTGVINVTTDNNAVGISVDGFTTANITNSGTINVTAYDYNADAAGMAVFSNGYVNVTNSGDINVTSNGNGDGPAVQTLLPFESGADGVGLSAISEYQYNPEATLLGGINDVNEVNSGDIYVNVAGNGTGMYAAAFGAGSVYMNNQSPGTVTVYAGGWGVGMWGASDYGTIEMLNSGDVLVVTDTAGATGMYAYSTGDGGTVTVNNSGTVDAYSEDSYAFGIWTKSYGNDAGTTITNSGTVYAESYDYSATGILAYSGGDYSDISVTTTGGLIDVYSYNSYATGIEVRQYGYESNLYVNNGGDINAESYYDNATGIAGTTRYDAGSLEIQNSGVVTVQAYNEARGIAAYGNAYGDTTVGNSGTLDVTSDDSDAYGIYAFSSIANVHVDNSGSINVSAYEDAYGIYAVTQYYGDIDVTNSGTITVAQTDTGYNSAFGIYAWLDDGDGTLSVDNSGSISVTGEGTWDNGIYAQSGGDYSSISVTNSGTVDVTSYGGWANGLYEWSRGYGVSLYIGNSGTVTANAYEEAHGIHIFVTEQGDAVANNSGNIDVYAEGYDSGRAIGIYAYADDDYDSSTVLVDNSGTINATGVRDAYGVYAISDYSAGKYGTTGNYTSTDVYNSGSISAISYETQAYGIAAFGGGYESYVMVDNRGPVTATGNAGATRILAENNGKYAGGVSVYNTGNVSAYAHGGDYSNATGIEVFGLEAYAYSGGSSYAYSSGASAHATGVQVVGKYASLVLGADSYTGAVAVGEDYAIAEGAFLSAFGIPYGVADVYADGAIHASATADAVTGEANAAGINITGYYGAYVEVGADAVIDASASAYTAYAYGVREFSEYAYFSNSGTISATVDGTYGYAFGALVSSPNEVYAYNYGDIVATAYGDSTQSVGIAVESIYNDAGVRNEGHIYAYADNIATGVWLSTDGYGYVYNTGVIAAYGGVHSLAIYADGLSSDYVYNQGVIVGEIWTNAGNDYLYNGVDGAWYTSSASYFGDGDDSIWNYGLIAMYDATIDLGYHDVTGNYFYNYGVIEVHGADNVINMGNGPLGPLVPSLNPNAFYNGGTIDFQDGDPDDVLTIIGDFAGDGDINVDVSGLDGTSDLLYIDGSVVSGTAGVINVDLVDLPNSIESLIPIVYVSGVSVDGNFVLGDVNWDEDNSFVTLDFGIVSDIDASNATDDVFSLGIEVTGLSDPGTLAASVGSSALSLINSQVGTWRQRMGVIDNFNKGAVALWARVFQDKGSFSPEHSGSNFGPGGNYDWDQKNSGVEAGIDFSVTDEFAIGLLLAKSQADTDLDGAGHGSTDMDADTWGIYGTWISPNGFYLDASYRWTSFDVDLSSVAGHMETEGDAETFNIEAGYAWTLSGGLKIEPQLQYTKTTIDNVDTLVTVNGMTFSYDDADSSRGRLGVAIRKSFGEADTGWLWTPYATLSAVREFDGQALYSVNGIFLGESDLEGTSALLELGFNARHQNWSIYGGLNWQDGGAVNSFFGGQLGVRYTFGGPAPAPAPVVPPPAKTCAELDDDGDGVNNCDDKCLGSAAGEAVGPDGCPVPAPEPAPEPKPFRG